MLVKGLPQFTQLLAQGRKHLTTGAPNHHYSINVEQRSGWQNLPSEIPH